MKYSGSFVSVASLLVATICCYCCYALESRANPDSTRIGRQKTPKIDPSCGTLNDLAQKTSTCAKPLMDLLQGTVEKWPRTEEDAMKLCDSYAWSERCIRDASRKCARGVQKTIISTLAQSINRARKRECSRSKAQSIVKAVMCLEREQKAIHTWMANVTARLDTIEMNIVEGDKKINGLCCILNDIEKELKAILSVNCNEEGKFILRVYRFVLEDVLDLICRSPKCNNYLKGYKVPKKNEFGSEIIAVLLRIVFSLDNDNS